MLLVCIGLTPMMLNSQVYERQKIKYEKKKSKYEDYIVDALIEPLEFIDSLLTTTEYRTYLDKKIKEKEFDQQKEEKVRAEVDQLIKSFHVIADGRERIVPILEQLETIYSQKNPNISKLELRNLTKEFDEYFSQIKCHSKSLLQYLYKSVRDKDNLDIPIVALTLSEYLKFLKENIERLKKEIKEKIKEVNERTDAFYNVNIDLDSATQKLSKKTLELKAAQSGLSNTLEELDSIRLELKCEEEFLEEANNRLNNLEKAYLLLSNGYKLKEDSLENTLEALYIRKDSFENQKLRLIDRLNVLRKQIEEANKEKEIVESEKLDIEREKNRFIRTKKIILVFLILSIFLLGAAIFAFIRLRSINLRLRKINVNRKKENEKLDKRYAELQKSNQELELSNGNHERIQRELREKNGLLESYFKEISHRVKNNLQEISSMLYFQSMSVHIDAKDALIQARKRIEAIGLIHKHLYDKKQHKLTTINLAEYIENLTSHLIGSFNEVKAPKTILTLQEVHIEIDKALSIGLIINELITNCFKHAFVEIEEPVLMAKLELQKDMLGLSVKDNGPGLEDDFSIATTSSFGLRMVKILVNNYGGNIEYGSQNGAYFNIQVPLNKNDYAILSN